MPEHYTRDRPRRYGRKTLSPFQRAYLEELEILMKRNTNPDRIAAIKELRGIIRRYGPASSSIDEQLSPELQDLRYRYSQARQAHLKEKYMKHPG